MPIARLLVGILGGLIALGTLGSAIKTVVVPRGEQTFVARLAVLPMRGIFTWLARRSGDPVRRDAVMARFGPTALMAFPLVWAGGVIIGCSGVFWALGVDPYREALALSGSSLTTLGIRSTEGPAKLALAILEGTVGLGLVALLISFLPTIYGAFSRREVAVAKLHVRALDEDGVPRAAAVLGRREMAGSLDEMATMWAEWEDWFIEVEESHTSFPILVFFRSPVPDRSWVASAGLALDAAALHCAVLDLPREPGATLMIRTGTLSLRRICDFFGFEYDSDPPPDAPISLERAEFEAVVDRFRDRGMPVVDDLDRAWADFAALRACYDVPLRSIATFVDAPEVPWATDRPIEVVRPRIVRRRR
ncbi:MAG: hypothetical protein AAF548_17150 [Actinomycetota bacterium]